MHPGLQRIFVNTILNNEIFKNHQFFFTTHSNHFLDLTLDYASISIFTFNKKIVETGKNLDESEFEIRNINRDDFSCLNLLGVKNSSVFLSNCTIWVEGITDRKYLAHYLDLYQSSLGENDKNFKEDLHYSFVEYSGNNIEHWSFLDDKAPDVTHICGRLFLIADKDETNKKRVRHDKLSEKLEDRFYLLTCLEIENLLSPEVLKKVVSEYEKCNVDCEGMKQEDYKDAPLGEFIEKIILKGAKQRKGSYSSGSGTITDKVKFCERAISFMKDYEADLSEEAKSLTKKIFNFIKKSNNDS